MKSDFLRQNKIVLLHESNRGSISVYWIVIAATCIAIAALPFIRFDITVKAAGIIRPIGEKTELRSSISTIIDTIYFKEGDTVKEGSTVIQLQRENIRIRESMNNFEINQRGQFINDLATLTRMPDFNNGIPANLHSPLYRQQTSRFIFQLSELNTELKKVKKELHTDSILLAEKVIAPKEMFDKQIEHDKLTANISATTEQQVATWQGELARYQMEKNQYQQANTQLAGDDAFYSIKAPVSGVLQDFNKLYKGSLVRAGDMLGMISPETEIIAECYIVTRDIGLLKQNQPVYFQIDAFDYNYFGVITGRIQSIDDDYTLIDNKPAFKVRCALDHQQLHLKNGFSGLLKKGMTLQARFVVTKRSAWQLLCDNINDWINPSEPTKTI